MAHNRYDSGSTDDRGIPLGKRCGSYTPGHDMHFIQARLSGEDGPGVANRVQRVDDDGTIHFADRTTRWNHDPDRLRAMLSVFGNDVFLAGRGVMRVPNGEGAYMICVADEPDPCRPETAEVIQGESIVDEIKRRGGFVRPVVRTGDDS